VTEAAVEDKETRPPPRYNEGTLVEAMQNAWRFVADGPLRDRLREAKGIGTPATRAEVIRGLKAQEFLTLDGKHIVPTERGLALFGVLERADPALVDPGVTAQLELLLDDVLVGTQEMLGAVDAVCAQALRIIGRLTNGAGAQALPPMGGAAFPSKTARGKAGRKGAPSKGRKARKTADKSRSTAPAGAQMAEQATTTKPPLPGAELARRPEAAGTPLRIPFGNKEAAQQLGARYRAGGWYAPPGVELDPFRERGWM